MIILLVDEIFAKIWPENLWEAGGEGVIKFCSGRQRPEPALLSRNET